MKAKSSILLFVLLITCSMIIAQTNQGVSISSAGNPAHNSAMLDVQSTTKGFLVPRMTKTQRDDINEPATGLMIYQTDEGPGYYYFDGENWGSITGSASYWVENEGHIYNINSGKVGIGTTTPTATLDIGGDFIFTGGSGDVDGDGIVNNVDAVIIYDYSIGNTELTRDQLARADVNADSKVDLTDAFILLYKSLGYNLEDIKRNYRGVTGITTMGHVDSIGDETFQVNGFIKLRKQFGYPPSFNSEGHLYNLGDDLYFSGNKISSPWSLTGNSGINPLFNFLGTSDEQSLAFRTNDIERMRITPEGKIGIGLMVPTAQLHVLGRDLPLGMESGNTTADPGLYVKAGKGGSLQYQGGEPGYGGELKIEGGFGAGGMIHGGSGGSVTIKSGKGGDGGGGVGGSGGNILIASGDAGSGGGFGGNIILMPGGVGSASGNIGIGTTSPQYPIHISKNAPNTTHALFVELNTNSENPDPNFTGYFVNNSEFGGTALYAQGVSEYSTAISAHGGATGIEAYSGSPVGRAIYAHQSDFEGLVLEVIGPRSYFSGRLGLGVETPSNKLHINATDPLRLEGLQASTQNEALVVDANGVVTKRNIGSGTDWSVVGNSGTNPANNFIGTIDNNDLVFRTNNAEKMRITYNGMVGIGTNNPNASLGISRSFSGDVIEAFGLSVYTNHYALDLGQKTFGGYFENAVTAFDAESYGVYGKVSSNRGTAYGIFGEAIGEDAVIYGLYGKAINFPQMGGGISYGVYAVGSGGFEGNYGIYATAGETGYGLGWAGYFDNGNVYIKNKLGIGTAPTSQQLQLTGSIELPSTVSSTTGIIFKDGERFLHNYGGEDAVYNTFLGINAGSFTVGGGGSGEGIANTGLGALALNSLQWGGENTAVGVWSLKALTGGYKNTTIGAYSGRQITTGSNNILMGYQAGGNLTTGSNNIIIGHELNAIAPTSSNQLIIGSNQMIFGDMSTGNIGLGTPYPRQKLDVIGSIQTNNMILDDPTQPLALAPDYAWPYNDISVFEIGNDDDVNYDGSPAGLYWSNFDYGNSRFEFRTRNENLLNIAAGGYFGNWYGNNISVYYGGTGQNTLASGKILVGNGSSGILSPTNLHWDNGNSRLGIGTSAPNTTQEIVASNPILRLRSSQDGSATAAFEFGHTVAGTWGRTGYLGWQSGDQKGLNLSVDQIVYPILFKVAGSEVARFQNNRLGIGVNNPSNLLHVNATNPIRLEGLQTSTQNETLVVDANGVVYKRNLGSGVFWSLSGNSGTNPNSQFVGTTDNQAFVFRTANTERVRITNTGNVAIGTTTPDANTALHVSKLATDYTNASLCGIYANVSNFDLDGVTSAIIADGTSTHDALYGDQSTYGIMARAQHVNNESDPWGLTCAVYGTATGGINNWAGYFKDGNVYVENRLGIGTVNPAAKLDIVTTGDAVQLYGVKAKATQTAMVYDHMHTYGGYFEALKTTSSFVNYQYGVYGFANSGSSSSQGNVNYGGYFHATGTGHNPPTQIVENIGVFGKATGSGSRNYAGYFDDGTVYVKGNVGVGTTDPQAKLHVDGDIKANGSISFGDNLTGGQNTFSWNRTTAILQLGYYNEQEPEAKIRMAGSGGSNVQIENQLGSFVVTSSSNQMGINGSPRNGSTLDVRGTGSMIVPVGTTAQRPTSAVQGMIRFNTTTSRFEGYNGSSWVNLD